MTDEEWHKTMLAKLDEWLNFKGDKKRDRPSLFDHMNMSAETFCQWRTTGHVPRETRVLWLILDEDVWERVHGRA